MIQRSCFASPSPLWGAPSGTGCATRERRGAAWRGPVVRQ